MPGEPQLRAAGSVRLGARSPLVGCAHVQVPKGHVWLQGDNFNNSTDSRHYGPVPYAMVRGRVFVKVGGGRGRPAGLT